MNFRDARYVYAVIHAAVKQSIGKHSLTPTIDFEVEPGLESAFQQMPGKTIKAPEIKIDPDYNPFSNKKESRAEGFKPRPETGDKHWEKLFEGHRETVDQEAYISKFSSTKLPTDTSTEANQFFQLHNRYILSNVRSGLMVIDQKKAHERILYEQYLKQLTGTNQPSQQQLFPHNIHLSPGDAEILRSLKDELVRLGFLMENLGSSGFVVNGIPSGMKESDVDAVLERIVENHKQEAKSLDFDKNANLAWSMAANTSVREGTKLSEKEIEDIFHRLFACDVPDISPDGKSIVNIIALSDFEKLMKK